MFLAQLAERDCTERKTHRERNRQTVIEVEADIGNATVGNRRQKRGTKAGNRTRIQK